MFPNFLSSNTFQFSDPYYSFRPLLCFFAKPVGFQRSDFFAVPTLNFFRASRGGYFDLIFKSQNEITGTFD
jgi:hypothetical protein